MFLARIAVLIVLPLLATTLQASVRSVPADAPARPSQESSDDGRNVRRQDRRERVVVLTVNMQVWRSADERYVPDQPGSEPTEQVLLDRVDPSRPWPMIPARLAEPDGRPRCRESTRAWMMIRYPHAPPM